MWGMLGCVKFSLDQVATLQIQTYLLTWLGSTEELDRRRVNKAQPANQNKGLNNDVQNACKLLIIEILQNLFRLNQS